MRERRRFIRIPERSQIFYREIPQAKIDGFITKNISQGGIRFFVREFVPKGKLLDIRLTIEEIPFSFKAIVRVQWVRLDVCSNKYEVGVEFVNIPKKASTRLIDYIGCLRRGKQVNKSII